MRSMHTMHSYSSRTSNTLRAQSRSTAVHILARVCILARVVLILQLVLVLLTRLPMSMHTSYAYILCIILATIQYAQQKGMLSYAYCTSNGGGTTTKRLKMQYIYIYINVARARTQYTRNTNVLCIVLQLEQYPYLMTPAVHRNTRSAFQLLSMHSVDKNIR